MSSADNIQADEEAEDRRMMCCASCGIAEVDDVKLKGCDDCDLVNYCGNECKEDHRPEHEAKCKERVAELRDEILFRQPGSSHLGDCPICCLPLPLDVEKSSLYSCCSKLICDGCLYADNERQDRENMQQSKCPSTEPTCPFCRYPLTNNQEEANKNLMKRIAANDPVALRQMGAKHSRKGEYDKAFEYLTKAAELGNASAHYELSIMYRMGRGVEKDETKELYHAEEAAIAGDPDARHSLGVYEWNNGRIDKALKHWIIAANLGHDESIQELKDCYKDGLFSKDDFAAALRAHHVAVNAMKSPQREYCEPMMKEFRLRS